MWDTKHSLPPSSQTIISLCSLRDGANFSLINVINTFIQGPKHHQGGLYVSCKDAHLDIILCMRVSLELKRRGMMFFGISYIHVWSCKVIELLLHDEDRVQYQINISYKNQKVRKQWPTLEWSKLFYPTATKPLILSTTNNRISNLLNSNFTRTTWFQYQFYDDR